MLQLLPDLQFCRQWLQSNMTTKGDNNNAEERKQILQRLVTDVKPVAHLGRMLPGDLNVDFW